MRTQAQREGLLFAAKPLFSAADDRTLRQWYPSAGAKGAQAKLPTHSLAQIYGRARALGLTRR